MPAIKRVYRFDRASGDVVEVTPKKTRLRPKWPIVSEAMAVNPEDVPRAQEILQQAGVSTEYDKEGCPILLSQGHRKKHAEALGFYDRQGGYGDPQARNR